MSQKKKSYGQVKRRLLEELTRHWGSKVRKKAVEELGFSYSSVYSWLDEDDDRPPSMEFLIAVCKRFRDVNMNYLLLGPIPVYAEEISEVSEPAPLYLPAVDYQRKYTECLEKNASLIEEILRLKTKGNE